MTAKVMLLPWMPGEYELPRQMKKKTLPPKSEGSGIGVFAWTSDLPDSTFITIASPHGGNYPVPWRNFIAFSRSPLGDCGDPLQKKRRNGSSHSLKPL